MRCAASTSYIAPARELNEGTRWEESVPCTLPADHEGQHVGEAEGFRFTWGDDWDGTRIDLGTQRFYVGC